MDSYSKRLNKHLSWHIFLTDSTSSSIVIKLPLHSNVKYGHDIFKECETLIPVRIVFIRENILSYTTIYQ
jgi:hypothetical protein